MRGGEGGVIPRILIVAGSDSGGGAGIQADIKTVTMLGGHAMTAVTALTAQNTLGVTGVLPVTPEFVLQQMDAVIDDLGLDAVKIGMIGSPETVHAVAERLERMRQVPVVFDPVMIASSGSVLADEATIAAFERLLRVATVATPNLPELFALAGEGEQEEAALRLADRFGCAVLAKGGHGAGETLVDLLVQRGGAVTRWEDSKIHTRHSHGTGCTLSSALATELGRGTALEEAVGIARTAVRAALDAAPGLGQGHGPLGHWAIGRTGAAAGVKAQSFH
jgi:hydroxymethylpyrimidine/phosphomethylpyrimidine kinase